MTRLDTLCLKMMEFDAGDAMRIQHFIKVHSLAALIGRGEGLDEATQTTLEAAAYVHDIGIHPAEQKYGNANGKYQEELGPAPARALLLESGFDKATADRVAWLVGHHHTYRDITGADYQILVEADFLVNLYEDFPDQKAAATHTAIGTAYERIFRTETGKRLCRTVFREALSSYGA